MRHSGRLDSEMVRGKFRTEKPELNATATRPTEYFTVTEGRYDLTTKVHSREIIVKARRIYSFIQRKSIVLSC